MTTTEKNKQLIMQLFDEVMHDRNYAHLNDIIAPHFVNHGMPGEEPGPEGYRKVVENFLEAFPDMKITVDHIIAEGDLVATRGHWTGTNNGPFMGAPASGKKVKAEFVDFWKIKDGICVENWVQMDIVGVMMQIGAMAPPPGIPQSA